MTCPACKSDIPSAASFCPSCGCPVDFGSTPTLGLDARLGDDPPREVGTQPNSPGMHRRKRSSSFGSLVSFPPTSFDGARFVPGTIIEDRYRIVALLGKGGMGEVYRAEDLKLSQTVALKFLPESVAHDGAALARFHREVRIARQVSHANVCRVFDIGETDGFPFLTMEYVDGEDLSTLLRRIGRLPPDKAIDVARQICAGLAAAHEHDVIHRDLKPANVMIDGRGKVRITDFGLAGFGGSFKGEDAQAGTPAYMAPEQLAGKQASIQSDVYALGLVLYEVFTGKRAYEAATLAGLHAAHEHSSPVHPSQIVKDIDPLVDRVILACLDKDPAKRPTTAWQVAAALSGGDPVAAALAAGETPSPEMIAASGDPEGLHPIVAWIMLAGVVVFVVASILLSAKTALYRRLQLDNPPEVLAQRAREIIRAAGYPEQPADTAIGLYGDNDFLKYLAEHDTSKTRWDHLESGALIFWYRGSPRTLLANNFWFQGPIQGAIWTNDPPLDSAGMTLVLLNPLGQLTKFIAVPPMIETSAGSDKSAPVTPDWSVMFSAAGLDPAKWIAAKPIWTPPVYSDSRAAWTGSLPERPDVPMRIEAAAYQGKPAYFQLIGPWTHTDLFQKSTVGLATVAVVIGLLLAVLMGSVLLVQRNLRLGRGDRRGAMRLAGFVFIAWSVACFFGSHHTANIAEVPLFIELLTFGVWWSCVTWVLYIALEPYVRRTWPSVLVTWNRLLAGKYRDPLVGRDVLAGCLLCASTTALERISWFVPSWLGHPPPPLQLGPDWQFLGAREIIADISATLFDSFLIVLLYFFVLMLFRALLRKEWLATACFVLFFSVLGAFGGKNDVLVAFVLGLISWGLWVFVLMRFGLLAILAQWVFWDVLNDFPLTTQGSAWYAGLSLAGILLMVAMTAYGFYTSLGGWPAFGARLFEE